MDALLADLILIIHLAFIAFVVFGQILIAIGLWRHWAWVRHFGFRIAHLLAIAYVMAETWLGISCPLTVWENQLRLRAGEAGYTDGFITYWVHKLIFYTAPSWLFTLIYTLFFLLVLASWIWGRPHRRRSGGQTDL